MNTKPQWRINDHPDAPPEEYEGLLLVQVETNCGDEYFHVGEIDATGSLFDGDGNGIGWAWSDVTRYLIVPLPKDEVTK